MVDQVRSVLREGLCIGVQRRFFAAEVCFEGGMEFFHEAVPIHGEDRDGLAVGPSAAVFTSF